MVRSFEILGKELERGRFPAETEATRAEFHQIYVCPETAGTLLPL